MSVLNTEEIKRYIKILRGDSAAKVQWQFFNEANSDEKSKGVSFSAGYEEAERSIDHYQKLGYGCFVTANPTDGKGSGNINIVDFNYAFADFDNLALPNEFPLPPKLITGRDDNHSHIYWPIKGVVTAREFNYLQRAIALYMGSDQQVIDPSRVLRVPGTVHLKDSSNPQQYFIKQDNSAYVTEPYSFDEIIQAFKLNEEQQQELDRWFENRRPKEDGSGFNDDQKYRDQLITFASVIAEPAVKGNGRSFHLIKVAGYGYDRGVSLEETQAIMWEHFNPRCEPPWTEEEKGNFYEYIKRGYSYYKNAPGSETVEGKFKALPEVPEPAGGWEENAKLKKPAKKESVEIPFTPPPPVPKIPKAPDGEVTRITNALTCIDELQAAELQAMVTNKSPVYDQALLFLGIHFPGGKLLRTDEIFYAYNGTCWEELADAYIKHLIHSTFEGWKLAPTKVKNIFDSLGLHCHVEGLTPGTWISTRRKTDSIVMKNGIVVIDRNGTVSIQNHTPDLFEINHLTYNYDPDATCPEFIKFVNQQWPDDAEMMQQVQDLYGMLFIDNSHFQKLPLFKGKSRSGKGVHTSIIRALAGNHNVCGPTVEAIIKDPIIETMSKSRIAIMPEANNIHPAIKGQVIDRMKSITGGDPIEYDRKYKGSATCSRWPLVIMSANKMPEMADGSGALANRVWPFVFTRSFAGIEDVGLTDRLMQEVSGIFNWAIEGIKRMMRTGQVTVSQHSKEFQEDLKRDSFVLADFVDDYGILGNDEQCNPKELYDRYVIHCRSNHVKTPMFYNKFINELTSSYLPISKSRVRVGSGGKREQMIIGMSINPDADDVYKPSFSKVADINSAKK